MVALVLSIVFTAAVLVAAGIGVYVIAARTASGRIGRNNYAGIRTPATMSSDEAWLAGHEAGEAFAKWGGLVAVITGAVSLLPALLAPVFGDDGRDTIATWWTFTIMLGTVLMVTFVLVSAVQGHRAAKEVRDG
ncbi:MAG: SdpI family protein [Actinomycetota bacterium]